MNYKELTTEGFSITMIDKSKSQVFSSNTNDNIIHYSLDYKGTYVGYIEIDYTQVCPKIEWYNNFPTQEDFEVVYNEFTRLVVDYNNYYQVEDALIHHLALNYNSLDYLKEAYTDLEHVVLLTYNCYGRAPKSYRVDIRDYVGEFLTYANVQDLITKVDPILASEASTVDLYEPTADGKDVAKVIFTYK